MARTPGLSKHGNIELNAKVFHAVQRTTLKLPLLESDEVFDYWTRHLKICCIEENVTVLCYILMANHLHMILYAENPRNIQRAIRRLNTGLSRFVWKNVVSGSEFEQQFQSIDGFKLFSSSVRMFPIEGRIPLLIDTRYLFDNPKHHECSLTGLRYPHSNFQMLANGRLEKKDFSVFVKLFEMYPGALMKLIARPNNEFLDELKSIKANLDPKKEALIFRVNPEKEWVRPETAINDSYRSFDI